MKALRSDATALELNCSHILSSMPLCDLVRAVASAPAEVCAAADALSYRDFVVVALVLDAESVFPDNWIYVHSPEVRLGRIQNVKNWGPEMVSDSSRTCLGLEYFCNGGDDLWQMPDDQLVDMGYSELSRIGLAKGELIGGYVVRVPKAYPVYDSGCQDRLANVRDWAVSVQGLICMERNGQHRYNNMDHSMMTALIAARNLVNGTNLDPWSVNEDAEYHEIVSEADQTGELR